MTQTTVHYLEHLVSHHLAKHMAGDRVIFHTTVNIVRIRDDHVTGDIVYHDIPIEGGTYYPHTNINQIVYANFANLRYVSPCADNEKLTDSGTLSIHKHSSRELSIEADEFGEWEFECFLNQINKEECGRFLFEAYGAKESIVFVIYPEKLHYFIEDAFDTYLEFERLLDKSMKKYGFL
jgi:hypothetical protein